MPLNNIAIKKQEDMEYIVIPEDVYLCEIKDLEEVEQQKYKAPVGEMEEVIRIKLAVLQGEFEGQTLVKQVRPTIGEGFDGGSPSGLYVFLKAVLGSEFEPSLDVVNSVIGKQVKAVVKVKLSQKGKEYNVVDTFMVARPLKVKSPDIEDIPVIETDSKDVPF